MSITGIAHVNLLVPPGTLSLAEEFYGNTLGFTRIPVPELQRGTLAWYFPSLPSLPLPRPKLRLKQQVRYRPWWTADSYSIWH